MDASPSVAEAEASGDTNTIQGARRFKRKKPRLEPEMDTEPESAQPDDVVRRPEFEAVTSALVRKSNQMLEMLTGFQDFFIREGLQSEKVKNFKKNAENRSEAELASFFPWSYPNQEQPQFTPAAVPTDTAVPGEEEGPDDTEEPAYQEGEGDMEF